MWEGREHRRDTRRVCEVQIQLKFNFPQDITCVVITPRLFRFSTQVYIKLGFCYEHGLSTANNVLKHGPTKTCKWHHRMWLNPDQEDVPKPGVMAHQRWHHSLPILHRSAMRFSSFFNQIIRKTSTGPCGDSPKVMVLVDLMALVLCTKSIGQWPFTLANKTLNIFIDRSIAQPWIHVAQTWLVDR
jgi:hypothetical protein